MAILDKALPSKWLQLALVITIALTVWAFLQTDTIEADVVELTNKRTTTLASNINTQAKQDTASNQPVGNIDWQKLKRTPLQGFIQNPIQNAFQVHAWLVVAPVKKLKPVPAPPPSAPPAPFIYMGKYEDTPANAQIFLLANGKLYSTMQGKNIDAQWRLDGDDANSVHLTFLPLNLPQVLSKAARTIAAAAEPVATEMNL